MTRRFPSRDEILSFIRDGEESGKGTVTRREIARAFGLKGEQRTRLRTLLKQMAEDGVLAKGRGKRVSDPSALPSVAIIDILSTDENGDLIAAPASWPKEKTPPFILMNDRDAGKIKPVIGVGDRVLARLKSNGKNHYSAAPIKQIGKSAERVLGVYRKNRQGGMVTPVSRKEGRDLIIERGDDMKAKDDDLVWAEVKNSRGYGPRRARIREIIANVNDPASYSLIAIANHDIRMEFPDKVLAEAENTALPDMKGREDLRALPLLTIDPHDAKDHDDAVFAEKTDKGWRVIVAIADVSWFVRPDSALDREAQKRGNSTYLPDQVVPMLPERLSNDLCSLKENVERPVLAVDMQFNAKGIKTGHKFYRAMMRSAIRLSYEEAQAGADGNANARTKPFVDTIIKPLWAAYKAVNKAREARAPLDLELPERKIILDDKGRVKGVKLKERFEAHKLIEEFMIQANVAAAETIEQAHLPLIYRVHDQPDEERVEALADYLSQMDYSLPKGQVLRPRNLNQILQKARERGEDHIVSQVILRAQSQAVYDTKNLGHFGLNLPRYAHFTSPIRRYADLTVHRALVAAGNLGAGAQTEREVSHLQKIAESISDLERQSMAAERESVDRFLAAFLSDKIGGEFAGRIAGVTAAGLFVQLDETGADGFVPVRSLGSEYFSYEQAHHRLIGQTTGGIYHLGQKVSVKLLEVKPLQGGLLFELLTDAEPSKKPTGKSRKPRDNRNRRKGGKGRKTAQIKKGKPRKGTKHKKR